MLWTVLPLTLVLIGVAFTGVYSHEQAMRDLVQERDRALAVVSAGQVGDLLQERVSALETLAAELAFHHGQRDEQRALLAQVGNLDGLFAGDVALLDESGASLTSGADQPAWLQNSDPVEGLARAVMAGQDVALSPVSAGGVFLVGVPVRDEAGITYGLLAGPVALDSLGLEALLSQVQVGEHGVVYLTDASGRILAHSRSEQARDSLAGHTGLDTALQDDGAGVTLCHAPDGERMTLAYAPVESGAGWQVIIEQPWHEVIGPVLRYSQFMPLVAALAVDRLAADPVLRRAGHRPPAPGLGPTGRAGGLGRFRGHRRARRRRGGDRGPAPHPGPDGAAHPELPARHARLYRRHHPGPGRGAQAPGPRAPRRHRPGPHRPATSRWRWPRSCWLRIPSALPSAWPRCASMLAETLEGVRRFSRDLRPIYLEDLGFLPALEMLVARSGSGGERCPSG